MQDFKKRGGFGGDRGGRSFGGGNRDRFNRPGNRDFRQSQMFSAQCAECGKACQVPFKPNGEKPVYCNFCFAKHKPDNFGGSKPFGGKDFAVKHDNHSDSGAARGKLEFDVLNKKIGEINAKLDSIISMITEGIEDDSAEIIEEKPEETVSKAEKAEPAPKKKKAASKSSAKSKTK